MITWSELSPSAKDTDVRLPNPDTGKGWPCGAEGMLGQETKGVSHLLGVEGDGARAMGGKSNPAWTPVHF